MASQTRAKFGYLNYETMLKNIVSETDPKKKLDAYDINFTPDTKECFVITPDLKPWAVKSKVYTFDNIESAIIQLEINSDTYEGQIVAIRVDEKFRGYIVNSGVNGWEVSSLSDQGDIDYNSLGNQPIINLTGTLDNLINAEDLETGIYKIRGQYTISTQLETVFLSASDIIVIVRHDEDKTLVKRITSDEIVNYVITSDGVTLSNIVTSDFLVEQGYITEQEVDAKIAALNIIAQDEVESYVQQVVNDVIDNTLDERIKTALDEKLQSIDDSEINNLF